MAQNFAEKSPSDLPRGALCRCKPWLAWLQSVSASECVARKARPEKGPELGAQSRKRNSWPGFDLRCTT